MICDASFVASAVIGQSYGTTMLQPTSFEVADTRTLALNLENPPDPGILMSSIQSSSQPFAQFLKSVTKKQLKQILQEGVMGFDNSQTLKDVIGKAEGNMTEKLASLKALEVETLADLHRFNDLALELPENLKILQSFRLPEKGIGIEGTGVGPCSSKFDFQREISKNQATDFLWTMHVRTKDNPEDFVTGFFLHRDPVSHDMILQTITSKKFHQSMRRWIKEVAKSVGQVDAYHTRVPKLTSDVLFTFWRQMVSDPESKFHSKQAITAVSCKQTLTSQEQVDVERARRIKDPGVQPAVMSYFVKPTVRPISSQQLATQPQSFIQPETHQVVVSRDLAGLHSSDVCIVSDLQMQDFMVVIDKARRRIFVIEHVPQAASASKWITSDYLRSLFKDKTEPEVLVQVAPAYLRPSEVLMAIACFMSLLRVQFVIESKPFRVIPSLTNNFLAQLFDLSATDDKAARSQVLGFCHSVSSGAYVHHKPLLVEDTSMQTPQQYAMKANLFGTDQFSNAWTNAQTIERVRKQSWKQPQTKIFTVSELTTLLKSTLQHEFVFDSSQPADKAQQEPVATYNDDKTVEKTELTKPHVNPVPPKQSLLFQMLQDCRDDECFIAAECIQPMTSGMMPNVYLHPLCAFSSTQSGDFGLNCLPFSVIESDKIKRKQRSYSIPFQTFYQLVISTKALEPKEALCTSVKPMQLGFNKKQSALHDEHANSKIFNSMRINLSSQDSSLLHRSFKVHARLSAAWLISDLRNRLTSSHFEKLMRMASLCEEDSLQKVTDALRKKKMSRSFLNALERSLRSLRSLQKGLLASNFRESAKLAMPLNFENIKSDLGIQFVSCLEMLNNTWRQFIYVRSASGEQILFRDVSRYELLFENPAMFAGSPETASGFRATFFPNYQIRVRAMGDLVDGFNSSLATALGERLCNAGIEPIGVFQPTPVKAGNCAS